MPRPKSNVDLVETSRRLRRLIYDSGIAGAEIADMLNISAKAVYNWMNEISAPSKKHRAMLCEILGTSMDELISIKQEAQ